MISKVEAFVFDMDGVIFDTETIILKCWEKIASENGLVGMHDVFCRGIGATENQTRKIMLDYYGDQFDYDKLSKQASTLFHKIENEQGLPMKPGVVELLELLQKKNIPAGLASSTKLALVEKELKDANIYQFFKVVIGGDLLEKSKPEPDIYLMACDKLKVEPHKAIAVEDSFNGIRSAYSAGMSPIMVPDLVSPDEEMREKTYMIVQNLMDIASIVNEME